MNDPYELVIPEKREQLRLMGKYLAKTVREYFRDPENRKKFEKWYKEKYGRDYVWETIKMS